MRAFTAFDDWMLDRVTQPVVDYLGRRVGISQASFGAGLAQVASFTLSFWLVIHVYVDKDWVRRSLEIITNVILLHIYWSEIRKARRQLPKTLSGSANPNRLNLIALRWVTLFITCTFGWGMVLPDCRLYDFLYPLAITDYYLTFCVLSCSPPPPRTQRASRWLAIWST